MKPIYSQSITEAKNRIRRMERADFTFEHSRRVAGYAREIAAHFPEVNAELIEAAAWWHDTGRGIDEDDHEQISAEMASASLRRLGGEKELCGKMYNAIVYHKWSMQPETLEGEIVRDADKLDFYSIQRWKYYREEGDYESLHKYARTLPGFREDFLHLEPSKKIFDRILPKLREWTETMDDPELGTDLKLLES